MKSFARWIGMLLVVISESLLVNFVPWVSVDIFEPLLSFCYADEKVYDMTLILLIVVFVVANYLIFYKKLHLSKRASVLGAVISIVVIVLLFVVVWWPIDPKGFDLVGCGVTIPAIIF